MFHQKRHSSLKVQTPFQLKVEVIPTQDTEENPAKIITALPKTFEQDYSLGGVLGQGCASVVRRGHDKNQQPVAIKIIKSTEPEVILAHIVEFRILHKLHHENIIRSYEMYVDQSKHKTAMIMEHFEGGTLNEAILRHNGKLPEQIAATLFGRLLDALQYLHSKQVAHRDIHPENILVNHECTKIKVIDFNVAKYFARTARTKSLSDDSGSMMTQTGNIFYRAPEVLNGGSYNEKVDLWSAGLCLYKMLHGVNPFFAETTEHAILEHIMSGELKFDTDVSVQAKDLLRKLLEVNPFKRLSAREALDHPWLLSRKYDGSVKLPRSLSQVNKGRARNIYDSDDEGSALLRKQRQIDLGREEDCPIFYQRNLLMSPKPYDLHSLATATTTPSPNNYKKIRTPGKVNGIGENMEISPAKLTMRKLVRRPGTFEFPLTKVACVPVEESILEERSTVSDDKMTKGYLDNMHVYVSSSKSADQSEIFEILGYYKGYFDELKMIKRDRSQSINKISPTRLKKQKPL